MKNMKWTFLLIFASILACQPSADSGTTDIADNPEIKEIYKQDQGDRQSPNIDWSVVSVRDDQRRARVHEVLDSNMIRTYADYQNAAMIFQHGGDSTSYAMAVDLMKKSLELNPSGNKWLLAAATDRYLLSVDKPQIYGTQYGKYDGEPWTLSRMDTTVITDAERLEYGVETLAQQREKVRTMNMKKLYEKFSEDRNIQSVVTYIKSEEPGSSVYNISESGINSFGYQLMREGLNDEALAIFKLNTELNPDGYNTHDSYGECLLMLGRKDEAIAAYQQSLALNPNNEGARAVIEENQ